MPSTIANSTLLVTGANRGIGQALVEEALRRGARRVYAGTRQPLARADARVTPLNLDVTDAAQIQAAVEKVDVARAILDGVEHGEEEIFPDPMSASIALSWRTGAVKAMERQNAALLGVEPIAS